MASNSVVSPYYHLQPSFATGEISLEVSNRVDLDKYSAALTKAENCLIRPYGPVYKRPGTRYCVATKYADRPCILVPFSGGGSVDYCLEFGDKYIRVHKLGEYLGVELNNVPYDVSELSLLRFTQSADVLFIAVGNHPLMTLSRYSETDWRLAEYEFKEPYFDESLGDSTEDCTISSTGTDGQVTLTASEDLFTSRMVGMYVKLKHDVASYTLSAKGVGGSGYSSSMYVGESWKIITHGTWSGTVTIQYSTDNVNWRDYRTYTANSDYNATESGSLSEGRWLRFFYSIGSGSVTIDLTRLSYIDTGFAKITELIDARQVSAQVMDAFGDNVATKQWSFSPWSAEYGYPKTVAFFQDRLCLGGNNNQPYMLWMSRTGDYNNFGVEKANGTVTDDSAAALSFVSRKQFDIKHLLPHTDLLVLTKGNEWVISGNEVVTPTNATPRLQTTRGIGDVEPIIIGNKVVFVQGRGSTIRDMGYSYETDSYGGTDLTILDKQIVEGLDVVDAAYMQEPNSSVYFVRSDGTLAVLTYVIDQKVYAWSTIKTDGKYEAVTAIAEGDVDTVYVVVKRIVNGQEVRYIEAFQNDVHSDDPNDYIMLDCAKVMESATKSSSFVVENLAGRKVSVLGDGREFTEIEVDSEGNFELPTVVNKAIVGLPYTMSLEMPNIEIKDRDGTMQGRYKIISGAILRLHNSLGGKIGPDTSIMDAINYDEYQAVTDIKLYSGDKEVQVPIGGFNKDGRISIVSSEAYPFYLMAVVREVSFGG